MSRAEEFAKRARALEKKGLEVEVIGRLRSLEEIREGARRRFEERRKLLEGKADPSRRREVGKDRNA